MVIAGLWVIGYKCPHNSPSSHSPLDISDSSGLFSEEDLGEEDVEGSSYSSPRLGSKQ